MENPSSKSYKCSCCKTVFVVRSDDRLDDDNVFCEKCSEKVRKRSNPQPEHPSTIFKDRQLGQLSTPDLTVEEVWTSAGFSQEYKKICKKVAKPSDLSKRRLFNNISRRLVNGEHGSVLGEIGFLASNKRSCLVRVCNATRYTINSNPISIYGEIDNSHCGPIDIFSQKTESYLFQKSRISLMGCAGIQVFDVERSNVSFAIAFRNYTIQLRKRSRNKVAIVRINKSGLNVDLRDFFRNMMEHKGPGRPIFNGCYDNVGAERILTAALASEMSAMRINFDNIIIDVKMTKNWDSLVEVTVSTNEPPRRALQPSSMEETPCEAPTRRAPQQSSMEETPCGAPTRRAPQQSSMEETPCGAPTRRAPQQSSMEETPCGAPTRRAPQQSSMEATPCETFEDLTNEEFPSEELHQNSEGIKEVSSCIII